MQRLPGLGYLDVRLGQYGRDDGVPLDDQLGYLVDEIDEIGEVVVERVQGQIRDVGLHEVGIVLDLAGAAQSFRDERADRGEVGYRGQLAEEPGFAGRTFFFLRFRSLTREFLLCVCLVSN